MPRRQAPQPPAVGDMVRLRGRMPFGKLKKVGPQFGWCVVTWDGHPRGPLLVHIDELERLPT